MDAHCPVCGEPWDTYHLRQEEPIWVWDLFRAGAGCPACEGEFPENPPDPEELVTSYLFEGDAAMEGDAAFLEATLDAVAGDTERPKWEPPSALVLATCACGQHGCKWQHQSPATIEPEDQFPEIIEETRQWVRDSFFVIDDSGVPVDADPLNPGDGQEVIHAEEVVTCDFCAQDYRPNRPEDDYSLTYFDTSSDRTACHTCLDTGSVDFCSRCSTLLSYGRDEIYFNDQGKFCECCAEDNEWNRCADCGFLVVAGDCLELEGEDLERFPYCNEGETICLDCRAREGEPRAIDILKERAARKHTKALPGME